MAILRALSLSRGVAMRPAVSGRLFSTSTRLALKETSTRLDNEKHKRDSLAKQRRGTGHWKPELATDSEEAVRADRLAGEEADPKVLQERTKMEAEERTRAGTSTREM